MNILNLPYILIRCLISTVVIEVLVAFFLKVRDKKDLINIALVNMITNPIVAFVPIYFNLYYGLRYRNISLLILEIITLFFEGFVYKKYLKYNKINFYILSLILNLSSYLLNVIINIIFY